MYKLLILNETSSGLQSGSRKIKSNVSIISQKTVGQASDSMTALT